MTVATTPAPKTIEKTVAGKTVTMTPEQAEAFGRELDALKERVIADLGDRRDLHPPDHQGEAGLRGRRRAMLFGGIFPPFLAGGHGDAGLSKIIDNMEIGRNVIFAGIYDWMGNAAISDHRVRMGHRVPGRPVAPLAQLHAPHVHEHSSGIGPRHRLRHPTSGAEGQRWRPYFLGNPIYAFLLMVLFQYGVALHELETERIRAGEITLADKREILDGIWRKTKRQTLKDYVAFPLLAGPFAPWVLGGNMTANLIRNVWSYMIIFCGHFPEDVQEFSIEETKAETRGMWYFRQILGSANLTGGKLFHLLSGNLSFQIEHHLFPDIPAHRHAEISEEVQEICRATASRTTRVRCPGSSPRWSARSSSWRCRVDGEYGAVGHSFSVFVSKLIFQARQLPPPRCLSADAEGRDVQGRSCRAMCAYALLLDRSRVRSAATGGLGVSLDHLSVSCFPS